VLDFGLATASGATIHGLEDAAGAPAIVMELVEGPTLADKLARGARGVAYGRLPLDEALAIAGQVADALDRRARRRRSLASANRVLERRSRQPDGRDAPRT